MRLPTSSAGTQGPFFLIHLYTIEHSIWFPQNGDAVEKNNRWTLPVSPEDIAKARKGEWTVVLTPSQPIPSAWFPPLSGASVLGLASAGGQQGTGGVGCATAENDSAKKARSAAKSGMILTLPETQA